MNRIVLSEVRNGVRTLTLNRADKLNAINGELIAGLGAALSEGETDPATRVMILRGAGRAFCSGMDRREFTEMSRTEASARRYIESLQNITRAMLGSSKLIVGAVHGWAVGGGLEWVLDCDLTIMAQGTRCFFPEMSLGLPVPTGAVTALLPQLIGFQKARGLFASGEQFDAEAASAMGLVWRVVPEAELFEVAESTAARLAALREGALREFKLAFSATSGIALEAVLAVETEATLRGFFDPATAQRIAHFEE